MTNEKYIQNQKAFIKRERKLVLRDHWMYSYPVLFLIALLIALVAIQVHPDHWQETTITLERYKVVHTGRAGSRLYIFDTTGKRYTVNRNEGSIKAQLVAGQQYSFTYADGFLHDTVEVIRINGTDYLTYEGSVEDYQKTKTILGVIIGVFFVCLAAVNLFCYQTSTRDKIRRIRKYQQRIQQRS